MKKTVFILSLFLLVNHSFASSTLVYDGGGQQARIQQALTVLGISYDLRNAANPVTRDDLVSHNLLIAGFNLNGDMSGLSASVLANGITGNIIITGHDADVHTVEGPDLSHNPSLPQGVAASTFLSQAIAMARRADSTGFIALADFSTNFSYLPNDWGILALGGLNAADNEGEIVTSFTTRGLESGIYEGLTPADMSNWVQSYHNYFTTWASDFSPLELGLIGQDEVVITVAHIIPAPAAVILTMVGVGMLGWLRRYRAL